jgi:DNA-binding transcriptional regulator LsrR (DeoR family)
MQSEKRKMITHAAKLYYYGHMTQEEISKMMDISRSKVSRMLLEAEQSNIVRISINDPYSNLDETAASIKKAFGLEEVIVVPSGSNLDAAKTNVGAAATDFLLKRLTETSRIGISWGTTLNAFVNTFKVPHPYPRACVVQLTGGMYIPNMHIDGRDVARIFAGKLGCTLYALQLPMFMHNPELKELILREPETAAHFRLFDNLDIALVGVGTKNYKDSIVYKANYISEEEAKLIDELKLCDICGHQIDINGREPVDSITNRLYGISLESLRKVPMVVGMCAGKDKARSIKSGIAGGYLKALIIDEIAALTLLESED